LIVYGKNANAGVNLGTRGSLADIGQTIARNFAVQLTAGESFLLEINQEESPRR
jgi:phosphopentomutase